MIVNLKEGSTIDVISYALSKQYTDKQLQKLEFGGTALTPESIANTLGYTPADDAKVVALTEEIAEIKENNGEVYTQTGTIISVELNETDKIDVTAETEETVTLVHQGKNFSPNFPNWNSGGIVGTPNSDGTYTLKGTATGGPLYIGTVLVNTPRILPAGTYYASSNMVPAPSAKINISNKKTNKYVGTPPCTFTLDEPTEMFWYINVEKGAVIDQTFFIQIEKGSEPTEFEQPWRDTYNVQFPTNLAAKSGVNMLYTESGDVLTASMSINVHGMLSALQSDVRQMKNDIKSPLGGKVINALGDSITSTDYTRPTWWEKIADKTETSFNNYGVSGTSIAVRADRTDSFVERAANLETSADAVIIMGGTNDSQTQRGAWDSTDNTTFYGALNGLLSTLCQNFAGKPIIFCTPMQTADGLSGNIANPGAALMQKTDTDNLSLQLRAEAIKQKCAQYGVHCIDLYNGSGINGSDANRVYFMANDTLHPSAIGQKRLANLIYKELLMFFEVE